MIFRWIKERREAREREAAREAARRADSDAWEAWQDAKRADPAWRLYLYAPPPSDELAEFARYEWPTSHIGRSRDFHPAMNVAELWWRPRNSDVVIEGKVLDLVAEQESPTRASGRADGVAAVGDACVSL